MGLSLREYERTIPPANRIFHESAEMMILYKEGILPLDPDEREDMLGEDGNSREQVGNKTIRRASR